MKALYSLVSVVALTGFLIGCQTKDSDRVPTDKGISIEYLSDDEGQDLESGARIAANSGKLTLEYLNNETEIFRPSNYTVRIWAADESADPSRAYIDGLGDGKYDHPTYTVVKNTARSYVRKTVKSGWYLAEFEGSGQFFKFNVATGSDGLLIYNENNFNAVNFRGYYPSYGKMKVGWSKAPGQDANTVLQFSNADGPITSVWIYAEDGTTTLKSQYWFMPAGPMTMAYNIGSAQSVSLNIQPGKVYPYVKLKL